MELKQHLIPKLKALRLSGILDTLDVRTREAAAEQWSYGEFLERLLEDEVERRQQKQLALRLRRAALDSGKTLETFDFTFNPSVNRQMLFELATGNYIREKRNVLLCGPTGTGKSHLAQALAHEACRRGFDVVFTNAHKMLRHLQAGRADDSYERRLALYVRADLLVIDDFGLKPLTAQGPEDLYDVIDGRYERTGQLTTCKFATGGWHTLMTRAVGGRLEFYVDNTLIATWVDSTPLPAYGFGLMTFDGAAREVRSAECEVRDARACRMGRVLAAAVRGSERTSHRAPRTTRAFGAARVAERTTTHCQAAGSGAPPGGGEHVLAEEVDRHIRRLALAAVVMLASLCTLALWLSRANVGSQGADIDERGLEVLLSNSAWRLTSDTPALSKSAPLEARPSTCQRESAGERITLQ